MSTEQTTTVEIAASFVKRLYRSDDGKYCVGLYESDRKNITLVGMNLPELHYPVTFAGSWVNDPRYGRQFHVEWVSTQLPQKNSDTEEFIVSMKVGIGAKRVKKMIAVCGQRPFWDVLKDDPETFLKVPGITKTTIKKLQSNITAMNHQKDLLQFLAGDLKMTGLRYRKLSGMYKDKMDEMLPDIRQNPFILQQIGIPFDELDYFCSRHSGFAVDDTRRLTAAMIQVLLDAQKQSHVGLPVETMAARIQALLSHFGGIPLR